MLTSLEQLELYAKGSEWILSGKPGEMLESALSGFKGSRIASVVAKSHVIVGTFAELKAIGNAKNLEGKTLITSAVDEERLAFFTKCKVNLVVDVSPKLFDEVVGINVIEAMILAALEKPQEEVSDDDFDEILNELDIKPRLLHPTGNFRNIRRFAFVIHPLSQTYIRNAFPIPKSTPKFVMDKVETLAAHMPPMVYCKMENIISPSGAEAEGWLISVGGTPKEMLSRSPEFTYRRLLHAAKIAEKMGAQIMGLGAFTKVVGDAGVTVARRAPLPITTGNSYSASGALWAAHDAVLRLGLMPPPKGKERVKFKAMVVGATGAIGAACSRLLVRAAEEVTLVSPETAKLLALKESILQETPDARVVLSSKADVHIAKMDMIVTATSGAGKKVLDIMKVKPGCVITDVARPLDLPPEEVAKRPDVLVIESGEILLPGEVRMKNIGLPPNVVYACLAETIVLALDGRFENFTVGRAIEWEKVREIYKMGLKHGMSLAAISGVNGVFSDEDIARVRNLALAAQGKRTGTRKPVAQTKRPPKLVATATVARKAKKPPARKPAGSTRKTSRAATGT